MPTKIEITCFTDLKSSTALTETLGHQAFSPILQDHLRVGIALALRNHGVYVKNIGDAHMVRFESVEHAVAFAAQLQQLCTAQPGSSETRIPVRVSLFQGPVEPIGADVFGSGVNQAARLQGVTDPGEVTINDDLFRTLRTTLGSKADELCHALGEHELKGIPGRQSLYRFDWAKYVADGHGTTLGTLIYDQLQQANIEPSNITPFDLNRPNLIIWPVVPRDLATAIHRCQIELIRLLSQAGWRVLVLIADCGGEVEYEDVYVESFRRLIEAHAEKRGVRVEKSVRMSELYEPDYEHYKHVQILFRRITSQMTVDVLMSLNTKEYSQEVKTEIRGKPTLTYLRPPLTLAAVLHLAEKSGQKCAVIAGADENLQWSQAYNVPNALSRLGVLMIPVVKMDGDAQVYQRRRYPIWHSEADVSRACAFSGSNVAWWLFRLLAFVPAFPDTGVSVGERRISPGDWADQFDIPEGIDLSRLISQIWPILNPA